MRLAAVSVAALVVLVLASAAAAADGRPWPGGTITYHERPSSQAVRDAAKAWNRSGVDIRFRRVGSARGAQVRVRVGGEGCGGVAQLGHVPGRQALMRVRRCPRWTQTQVAAHEFGHIMGLDHTSRRCALMNPVLFNGAPNRCTPPRPGYYRCRLFERNDLRRAVRMYGGRVAVGRRAECPLHRRPAAPRRVEVERSASVSRAIVRLPAAPKAVVAQGFGVRPPARLQVAQRRGACPADPRALFDAGAIEQRVSGWGRTVRVGIRPIAQEQCVAARVVDGIGRSGPPRATLVPAQV
jgi:hypothetical protein